MIRNKLNVLPSAEGGEGTLQGLTGREEEVFLWWRQCSTVLLARRRGETTNFCTEA